MLKKSLLGGAIALGVHSAIIYNQRSQHHRDVEFRMKKEESIEIPAEFRIGGTDDRLIDNMRTGDIFLMRRKWHLQYLPLGLAILLYRNIFDAECDSVGIVAVNKMGEAFLVENTPFQGVKVRPIKDRLRHSESELIVLQDLEPRSRKLDIDQLMDAVHTKTLVDNAQVPSMLWNYVRYVRYQYLGGAKEREVFRCANMVFLEEALKKVNIDINYDRLNSNIASLKALEDHDVTLQMKGPPPRRLSFPKEETVLRTR